MTRADTERLLEMAKRISPNMTVRRCVFGHGYPSCGCLWRLYYIDQPGGGLSLALTLGDTIPKATLTLRGVLFGLNLAQEKETTR